MYIIGKITPEGKLHDIELKRSANTLETNKKIISVLSNLKPFGQMPESMSSIDAFKISVITSISAKGYFKSIKFDINSNKYFAENAQIDRGSYMRKLENNKKIHYVPYNLPYSSNPFYKQSYIKKTHGSN